ncbi:hypothetical protein ACLOJK_026306 [Asimina triloba]
MNVSSRNSISPHYSECKFYTAIAAIAPRLPKITTIRAEELEDKRIVQKDEKIKSRARRRPYTYRRPPTPVNCAEGATFCIVLLLPKAANPDQGGGRSGNSGQTAKTETRRTNGTRDAIKGGTNPGSTLPFPAFWNFRTPLLKNTEPKTNRSKPLDIFSSSHGLEAEFSDPIFSVPDRRRDLPLMSTDDSSQAHHGYVKMQSEPTLLKTESSSCSLRLGPEPAWVFDELPSATIVSISRPDPSDISPLLLTYTIEFKFKQVRGPPMTIPSSGSCVVLDLAIASPTAFDLFRWRLVKKAPQVFYLHFALKKRAFIEELHEKQEQVWALYFFAFNVKKIKENRYMWFHKGKGHREVDSLQYSGMDYKDMTVKEWLQNLGIGEHITAAHDDDDGDDDNVPPHQEESVSSRYRDIPSSAALPIIRPALGRQHSISDRAKVAMQGYLNHFLGNMDIVNSREVWAVLKPGFLAFLRDPFDTGLLDIIVFDVLPPSDGNGEGRVSLAKEIKERNPLRYGLRLLPCWESMDGLHLVSLFLYPVMAEHVTMERQFNVPKVSCGNRSIRLRAKSSGKVKDWVAAINDAGLRPPEGWCHPHRFGSFAPPRGLTEDGSRAQWFVDGKAAFEAIASSIESAKSEIELVNLQIYILLYKEVALALKINRLDLCFGRFDTFEHRVGDCPPSMWPGKDYYNPRESEPNSWEDTMKDELDRKKYPRMPWHDVHCALWGPPCRDVARHFVQRWNFAKRNKALNEQAIPLLMPQQHMVIPHYMGKSKEADSENMKQDDAQKQSKNQDSFSSRSSYQDVPLLLPLDVDGGDPSIGNEMPNGLDMIDNLVDHPNRTTRSNPFKFRRPKVEQLHADMQLKGFVDDLGSKDRHRKVSTDAVAEAEMQHIDKEWWEAQERGSQVVYPSEAGQVGPCTSCRCQVIRSVGQWSAGTSQTEESIHNAYCSLIEKSEHFVYIEVIIPSTLGSAAYAMFIFVLVMVRENIALNVNQFFISGLSGDDIIRNRVLEALCGRIMRAEKEKKCFRVIIVIPLLPGFQGGLDDGGAASVRAIMHWQYRTICRGPNSILENLYDKLGPKTHDYISFYGLRSFGRLHDGGPLATSQVYVHSKIMIIDDRIVLLGSANINDRSLLGSRDSEIGVVIEDKDFIDSSMNGRLWKAGKFAVSLRQSLWSEHLGLHPGEVNRIVDPVCDATFKDIWMATAKTNTTIYQDVFACIPNDLIHSRAGIRQSTSHWKEKLGHTTIDLGIAPNRLESYEDGNLKTVDPMQRLESVRGHLVAFPLEFMCKEDLRPVFNESEYYASPQEIVEESKGTEQG